MNADSYASTGQGLLGNNMFAYCGNNPVTFSDSSGMFWEELWDAFTKLLQENAGFFAVAGGVSQVDSPAIGPADIVAGTIIIGAVSILAGIATYNTLSTLTPPSFGSSRIEAAYVSDELESIASSFGNFRCKEAAENLQDYLEKNDLHGEIITISYIGGRGYVWSDTKGYTISNNGIHVGVLYNGLVYCNVHPYGLPESAWINDFYGTGIRIITRIPF